MADKNVSDENTDAVVVMVPLPAQGHLNQLLHLSHILVSSHGLPVHFVSTPTHNRQAQLRIQGRDPEAATSKIHFHDFSIPFSTPSPNPNTADKLPVQLFPSFIATVHLREPVYELIKKLSITSRRVIVIHDSLMFYVIQDVLSVPNAESYCFHSITAFNLYVDYWERAGKAVVLADGEPINDLSCRGSGILFPEELVSFFKLQDEARKCNWGNLYNTSRLIEGEYLNSLAQEKFYGSGKQWAIGPLNPLEIKQDKRSEKSHSCLDWLDKQLSGSVIFVSFGSTTSLCDEQVEEIAIGLENSGQKFIWVLRDADRGDVFAEEGRRAKLPDGFGERIANEGSGMIVRDWAPQLEILGHSSTGGFMSHCGWNSCIESTSLGVPMATWPMHSDQPINAILVTKVLKIGVMVGDWGHQGELVKANIVEKAVKTLMDSSEGHEMRQRAAELNDAIKKSVTRGGENTIEMDAFVAYITR